MIDFSKQFHQEARDILESLGNDILRAEADPENQEILNAIFRGIHTIKGSAGSFDMEDISEFAHHLESILNALRNGELSLSSELVDLILAGADHISRMLESHAAGKPAKIDHSLVERFQACLPSKETGADGEEKGCDQERLKAPSVGFSPPEAAGENDNCIKHFRIGLRYTSEALENGYDPVVLLQNLRQASKSYRAERSGAGVPVLDEFEPLSLYLNPVVHIATELTAEEIKELCFDPELMEVEEIQASATGAGDAEGREGIDPASLNEFLVGAREMIEYSEKAIISYEATSSREALNEVFRAVHTIKGDADYIGLETVKMFSHALESLLDRLRSGSLHRTSETVDMILQAIDYLRVNIEALASGKPTHQLPPVFYSIESLLQNGGESRAKSENPSGYPFPVGDLGRAFLEQAIQYADIMGNIVKERPLADEKKTVLGRCLRGLARSSGVVGIKPLELMADKCRSLLSDGNEENLSTAIGEVISYVTGPAIEPKRLGEILLEDGKITESDLESALAKQKPIGKLLVESGSVSEEDVARALKKQELMETARELRPVAAGAEPEVRTMRIDERKIENFTSIIGELLIARNTYEYLFSKILKADGADRDTAKALKENLHLLTRLTNDMHHGVMSLRMIPIRGTFQKFARVVRDISRKQKKQIDLITDGEELEIDKKVADMLSDPLVHAIRNACDHGIESPDERRRSGKPEKGTILLRASQEGSSLTIKIIDDGKGIDRQKLMEKAESAGLDSMSSDDPALLDLIFMPGLSTKAEVTDLSGRGVGMDVVKSTVHSLGGTVQVVSEEGNGTEISLSIPMTMGINSALLVEVQDSSYALPLDRITETLKLPVRRLRKAGRGRVFHHRGEVLPADDLCTLLDAGGEHSTSTACSDISDDGDEKEIPVVIVNSLRGKRGVIVDRFDKNVELAIKPVPRSLADIDVISGVSIMGDGKILLVLNPDKLF